MKKSKEELWQRFQKYYSEYREIGLAIDLSRIDFSDDFFESMEPRMQKAFEAMDKLEKGETANPDEKRMVGHYWLRNPAMAPSQKIREEIEQTVKSVEEFASKIHRGEIAGAGGAFRNLLLIGISGSALGPQFVSNALSHPAKDKLKIYFFDNTDPDGMQRVLAAIDDDLSRTLCIVISKSGGTKETRNGMLEAEVAYLEKGLAFASHAVAITGRSSALDERAESNHWLGRFPMWDWVRGRTSELSAVGLLPAALQGFDIQQMLNGARRVDDITRLQQTQVNPAAMLALAWFYSGNGNGSKDMVVLPYKDRLELFSRYLQQLIMESLGKEFDLSGKLVNQGLSVYGNKGSTDQHAYVQQLRDGINNYFAVFIQVLRECSAKVRVTEGGATSGDYLMGFLFGTREALYEKGRQSLTITVSDVSAFSIGVLIALFERAVGLYASLININAYNQPGVEAGKKAAESILDLQARIIDFLKKNSGCPYGLTEIAQATSPDYHEGIFKICQYLSCNPNHGIHAKIGKSPFETRYYSS